MIDEVETDVPRPGLYGPLMHPDHIRAMQPVGNYSPSELESQLKLTEMLAVLAEQRIAELSNDWLIEHGSARQLFPGESEKGKKLRIMTVTKILADRGISFAPD
jgi:hypothetical protein